MKTDAMLPSEKSTKALTYRCIFAIGCIMFLYIHFRYDAQYLLEHILIIPCMILLGSLLCSKGSSTIVHFPRLSLIMSVWLVLLQAKRSAEGSQYILIGPFLSAYLLAFPLATFLEDGNKKKALQLFAGIYLAATAVLSIKGLLLILDCLPESLSDTVLWDGSRLQVVWHPNVVACYCMIGTAICTAFLSQAKSFFPKLGLSLLVLIILTTLALTNCRTAIILTGGYLGATLFFSILKHGRKWFIPGVLVLLAMTVGFFTCAKYIYEANSDVLLNKYTQQYLNLTSIDVADATSSNTDNTIQEATPTQDTTPAQDTATAQESLPINVNTNTGEISLKTTSPQGSLKNNFKSFNGRTDIWKSSFKAIQEHPKILWWGTASPAACVTPYHSYILPHLHNSWVECLIGTGLFGFIIVVLFTLQTLWNCLFALIKNYDDTWTRILALLALCLMAAAIVEPYLFYPIVDYHPINFLFFLCAGYLNCWQKDDNFRLLAKICSYVPFLKR